MDDPLNVFILVLGLFYSIDCLVSIGSNQVLFSSWRGGRGTFHLKGTGLHFASFVPSSEGIMCDHVPVCFTHLGIHYLKNSHRHSSALYSGLDFNFIAYENIQILEVSGTSVIINDQIAINTCASSLSRSIEQRIAQLLKTQPSNREEQTRQITIESMSVDRVLAARKASSRSFLIIKVASWLLFLEVFVLGPMVVNIGPLRPLLYPELLMGILLTLVSVFALTYHSLVRVSRFGKWRAIRFLGPRFLSPVTAIHMVSSLARDRYVQFDHLALGAVLLPQDQLKPLVSKDFQRITLKQPGEEEGALDEWRILREDCLRSLVEQVGVSWDELKKVPVKSDPAAVRYCPLCEGEYHGVVRSCFDCNVELIKFVD